MSRLGAFLSSLIGSVVTGLADGCSLQLLRAAEGGMDAKVSAKQVQRRIADLDAPYTVAQPKRSGGPPRRALALIVLAIIAVAAFASANRTTSDFVQLTLKEGPIAPKRPLSDAEAQAKWNAMWGAASPGFKRGE